MFVVCLFMPLYILEKNTVITFSFFFFFFEITKKYEMQEFIQVCHSAMAICILSQFRQYFAEVLQVISRTLSTNNLRVASVLILRIFWEMLDMQLSMKLTLFEIHQEYLTASFFYQINVFVLAGNRGEMAEH